MIQILDQNDKAQIEQKIKTVSDETNSLKEDMNDLATFERYPNLITNYDILENTILNNVGSTESNNSYATFKYGVPVKSGKSITCHIMGITS